MCLVRHALAGSTLARRKRRSAGPGAAQLHRPGQPLLPTRAGFVQGYNVQIAVDAAHQGIVAHRLVTNSADYRALVAIVDGSALI